MCVCAVASLHVRLLASRSGSDICPYAKVVLSVSRSEGCCCEGPGFSKRAYMQPGHVRRLSSLWPAKRRLDWGRPSWRVGDCGDASSVVGRHQEEEQKRRRRLMRCSACCGRRGPCTGGAWPPGLLHRLSFATPSCARRGIKPIIETFPFVRAIGYSLPQPPLKTMQRCPPAVESVIARRRTLIAL